MKVINLTPDEINKIPNLSDALKVSIEYTIKEPLERLIFVESESYITPFAIIAVSNSAKHIDAMCSGIIKNLKEKSLFTSQIIIDGNGDRGWCIMDFSNCFFNIMTEEKFQKYSLEKILKGDFKDE